MKNVILELKILKRVFQILSFVSENGKLDCFKLMLFKRINGTDEKTV